LDIAGAKALKQRLGHHSREESLPGSANVPEHAPPVYHYLGVEMAPDTSKDVPDDARSGRSVSRLRRLLWLSD
jgi:hypothetical protein